MCEIIAMTCGFGSVASALRIESPYIQDQFIHLRSIDIDALASLAIGWPEEVLERLAEGVVLLTPKLKPQRANRAARVLLGLRQGELPPRVPSEEVLDVVRRTLDEGAAVTDVITTWFPERRSVRVRASFLPTENLMLVVLEDVTEEIKAQRVRREFVAHASHELKSPVAGLQALAEALTQALEDDPETVARFAGRIVSESERLGRLINELLDLSRLEDVDSLPVEPVDLSGVTDREVLEISADAEAKDMALTSSIDPGVWIRGDESQLGVLIRNLLENAVRYTPDGRSVTVSLKKELGRAVLQVEDSGIGIPQEAQSRVFERFYRVDRARSRDRGGTGLGLAIVKHVAELHRGEVTVSSEVGSGSIFTASFPLLNADDSLDRSA